MLTRSFLSVSCCASSFLLATFLAMQPASAQGPVSEGPVSDGPCVRRLCQAIDLAENHAGVACELPLYARK